MDVQRDPLEPSPDQPMEFRKKDGSLSKMRNHRGNIPILPQTKLCPHCPAKFTRTTHLNRHLRTHTNERLHRCDTCDSQFTRSDLLTRHKKSCNDPTSRTRRKSCASCMESKIKCDRQYPCSKCASRGKDCVFTGPGRRASVITRPLPTPQTVSYVDPPLDGPTTPSILYAPAPQAGHSFSNRSFHVQEQEEILRASMSMPSFSDHKSFPSSSDFSSSSSMTDLYPASTSNRNSERPLTVNSHLSPVYANDVFAPFFSSIFSQLPPTVSMPDDSNIGWAGINLRNNSPEALHFLRGVTPRALSISGSFDDSQTFEAESETSGFSSLMLRPPLSDMQLSPIDGANYSPDESELQHYLYLFVSTFLPQIPIVHPSTFSPDNKPPILLCAMYACGALYVKTRKAAVFISQTLASAREALVQEFAKNPTDSSDQIHLILAVVLLQTIGLFHQQPDQRASSSIYHGMLVMMIRRTGLISKNAHWTPRSATETSLEILWHEWIVSETAKRAIWWSYLHDCCHSIYFALPSSYHPSEIELNLPCDGSLWQATTSTDWFMALQTPSLYGNSNFRLIGMSMSRCLSTLSETRHAAIHIPLSPFAHFVLIHAILRDLFVTCVEGRFPKAAGGVSDSDTVSREIYGLQYALHNWLQNWLNSPELPKAQDPNEEPPFINNVLPFYWLGQVSLLAYQESLPPFEQDSPNNLKVEVRFRIVKQWLKHIRGFLKNNDDQQPTLFWDELMRIRLQTWQQENGGDNLDDQEGLLGFFPEH
ncbi:fungal-specific transcription factor domain-containing protein [Collybia nuda]|uniref:Fungal-specific transcription factor domain-containing protein n=1 Tax=Collybia nuda TaxID=64659 RepID=A0A9P5YED7_9AGAR|nr:fungal-specific transcription factor domain-containing protein [Collybia nuda]